MADASPVVLRLLMVEDSESDSRLLARELKAAGYAVTSRRVDTAPALRDSLKKEARDVINSDHRLSRFCAPEALAIARAMARRSISRSAEADTAGLKKTRS